MEKVPKNWIECPKCHKKVSQKGMIIHKSRYCIFKNEIKSPTIIGGRVPFSIKKWYKKEAKKRNINISELLRIIPSLITIKDKDKIGEFKNWYLENRINIPAWIRSAIEYIFFYELWKKTKYI